VKAQVTQSTWVNTDQRVASTPVVDPQRPLGVTRPRIRTRANVDACWTIAGKAK
jgi:hypothetical protein